jgi:hypothetical protein
MAEEENSLPKRKRQGFWSLLNAKNQRIYRHLETMPARGKILIFK